MLELNEDFRYEKLYGRVEGQDKHGHLRRLCYLPSRATSPSSPHPIDRSAHPLLKATLDRSPTCRRRIMEREIYEFTMNLADSGCQSIVF